MGEIGSARGVALAFCAMAALGFLPRAWAQTVEQLKTLSIEQLANIEITSVSKTSEKLSDAAASVYVITHDDIIRSGATTIPEMLRLAPNLEVAQINASSYAVSARGFNVNDNAALSNKLLVLIDGRTVYTPLFGGVYWDMQAVPPEDIERIEVISGPGATLYGANAVNGVINIITKPASETQGGLLDAAAGNRQWGGLLQYGGSVGANLAYRVYGEGQRFGATKTPSGFDAEDAFSRPQGGFRLDWTPRSDRLSIEGQALQASEEPGGSIAERNLTGNWHHQLENGSALDALAYFDDARRGADNGLAFNTDTYDLELQHSFQWGRHALVSGAGDRVVSYNFNNTATLLFEPGTRTLNLADVFAQDTITLTEGLKLILGMKLEDEPFTGLEPLPDARVSWKIADDWMVWAAVSRAMRSATPVERDIVERAAPGGADIIAHSFDFMPETLTAYEIGTRAQPTQRVSFSVSAYYDQYDDLRSIESAPGTVGPPFRWSNGMEGLVYGVEGWGSYQLTPWWRLSAGLTVQHEHLRLKSSSNAVGGLPLALALTADDPNHWASLRSSMDLGHGVTWDLFLRYVGRLHTTPVPDYGELNTRIGWAATPWLELSVSGFNLIHAHHPEFVANGVITNEIPRSFLVDARLRF